MTPRRLDRNEALAAALLALVWLAASAWVRPLMLPDEGRYVGVAWEMLRSGDAWTPTLNGLPYFHKPPLFYWITAGSMALFGASEWSARAAPIVGAWLGAVAIHSFASRWLDRRTAQASLVALLSQPLFLLGGQFANLDMLVAGCITATIVLLADSALCFEQGLPHRRALLAGYVTAALGVLAKGLIGLFLPALVLGLWLVWRRQWRSLRALLWWAGPLAFALIALPWFAAMQMRFEGFLHYFVIVQHLQRFAGGGFNNPQPIWFYPAVLLLFTWPWLPWLQRLRRPAFGDPARGPVRLLMLQWVVVVLLFFSLPRSKLLGYILPAVPPLALLVADAFAALGAASSAQRRGWWTSAVLGTLASLAIVAFLAAKPKASSRELGAALVTFRQPGQPVVMLERYAFDLPFYARMREPVTIVDDWAAAAANPRDDWRQELLDAAGFAAPAAAAVLVGPGRLQEVLCGAEVSWVLADSDHLVAATSLAFTNVAEVAWSRRGLTLWRIQRSDPKVASALGCAGTPNAGSAGTSAPP